MMNNHHQVTSEWYQFVEWMCIIISLLSWIPLHLYHLWQNNGEKATENKCWYEDCCKWVV